MLAIRIRVPQYKVQRAARHMNEAAVIVHRVDTGDTHDATKSEADAFWSWAVVETLRHTGIFSGGRPWGRVSAPGVCAGQRLILTF